MVKQIGVSLRRESGVGDLLGKGTVVSLWERNDVDDGPRAGVAVLEDGVSFWKESGVASSNEVGGSLGTLTGVSLLKLNGVGVRKQGGLLFCKEGVVEVEVGVGVGDPLGKGPEDSLWENIGVAPSIEAGVSLGEGCRLPLWAGNGVDGLKLSGFML